MHKRGLGRPGRAILTDTAEVSNVANVNGVLDALFSQKARLAAQSKQQLTPLFRGTRESYGRSIRAGLSSKKVFGK